MKKSKKTLNKEQIISIIKEKSFWKSKEVFTGISIFIAICGILLFYRNDTPKSNSTVVEVVDVKQQNTPKVIELPGNIESYITVDIKSRVDGQIMTVNFKEGQNVKKGDLLFQLDSRGFVDRLNKAQAMLESDLAKLTNAQTEEKRYAQLVAQDVVSVEAYQQKLTNLNTAQAIIDSDKADIKNAQLQIDYSNITSPIDGKTGPILLKEGSMVKASDTNPLVTINTISPIYCSFSISEKYLDLIKNFKEENLLKLVVKTDENAEITNGEILFFDNQIDVNTGTIKVKGLVPNKDEVLWPGESVRVYLQLYSKENAIIIPDAAVQIGPKGQYVFVIDKNNKARIRNIKVDFTNGAYTVIADGLKVGEKVVTNGQIRLQDGSAVKTVGENN
jgi:multidrug efflux system membrane fusion protein